MRALHYISIPVCILCGMLAPSCDVHEFPDPTPKPVEFTLDLEYDSALPLHKVVEYNESTRSGSTVEDYDIRYTVKLFDADAEGAAARETLYSFEFFKEDASDLNTSLVMELLPDNYKFIVWADYVTAESLQNLYYDAANFEQVALCRTPYVGSDDMRDAFRGSVVAEVSKTATQGTITMTRPLAKFNFISTDIEAFTSFIADMLAKQQQISLTAAAQSVNLDDYTVLFRYHGFTPSSFNLFADRTADALSDVTFTSSMSRLSSAEAELGFDYLFVNDNEAVVVLSVELYDKEDNLISQFKPVEVPLVRSKLTTVRANFLTSKASGGATIDPDFDGNHNITIE